MTKLWPNAAAQPRLEAGATEERRLYGVGCSRWLGAGEGRDTVPTHLFTSLLNKYLRYCFNSFFSSVRKRQSVPWAMSFWGLALIIPSSCRRRA